MNEPISRREFARGVAALGAATLLGASKLSAAKDLPIGIQLYTVRDVLAKDFKGGLEKVARIGYRHFEFAGYGGMDAGALSAFLKELGVSVCGTHEGYEGLQKDPEAVFEFNKAIGNSLVVIPSMPWSLRNADATALYEFAYKLNVLGYQAKKHGLQLCYHNHSFEFAKVDGERTIWDILFAATDPELVKAELDVAWAFNADVDPVALMDRYADRIVCLHMKDLDKEKKLAPVGEGVIPMKKVVKKAQQIGVKWYIVEQDNTRKDKDILDEIAISYAALVKLLS